ncbi:MAG: arsenate reductase ArsC [Candidatus Thermoplasmatota archaeon]|nr:arsenate reductase ArsC [Candidatus Thermoplasmatota archaeon]
MAEGLLNTLYKDKYKAFSAGIQKTSVNPYAVEVMKEIGIDISMHYSKTVEDFKGENFDVVVTVCNHAHEACPFFPGKKVIHRNFDDPSSFTGSVEDTLAEFRKTRDDIKKWIITQF